MSFPDHTMGPREKREQQENTFLEQMTFQYRTWAGTSGSMKPQSYVVRSVGWSREFGGTMEVPSFTISRALFGI